MYFIDIDIYICDKNYVILNYAIECGIQDFRI